MQEWGGGGHVQVVRTSKLLFERSHLTLVRFQRGITILRELLRALRILLEQIMRLREPYKPLHQRPIIRNERLHTQRERLDAEYSRRRRRAVGE